MNYLRKTPVHGRSQATIEKVLTAAQQQFLKHGYDKTTTRHIAAAAGIPIGSLYHFFPNKQAVLDGLAHSYLQQQAALHQRLQPLQPQKNLVAYIDTLVEAIAEAHKSSPPFEQIIHAQSAAPEIHAYVRQFNQTALENTYQNMAAAFPNVPPVALRPLAETSVAMVKSLLALAAGQPTPAQTQRIKQHLKTALYAIWSPVVD